MINNIEIFQNETLLFLEKIENEVKSIDIFQIDYLYDIIDLIYDGKLIIKEFNKNLFRSIDKGIITFKYDIKDYIENIIGELLYLTDFLSININKNEIMQKANEDEQRNITVFKLKRFRDIIITIMDTLGENIYNDYDNEMSLENNNSIKYYTENLAKEYYNEIEEKANNVSDRIKLKINYINLYEKYSNNINLLNNINKNITENFNNDIYTKIIKNISYLSPEYLNQNSNIIKKKKQLFDIAKEITNTINTQIKDIDNGAISYSKQYIEKNLYNFHYNLYNFRKYFLNNQLDELLNEFISKIENLLITDFKQLIDVNYGLAYQYLNEENDIINSIGGDVYLGSTFVNRYYEFVQVFTELMFFSFPEELYNLIEINFYKVKNDIINYINNELKKLNKYNFNNEIRKNNFYFIEQLYNEINNIKQNINDYFNEEKYNILVKVYILNISTEIIRPYVETKAKDMQNFYDNLNKRVGDKVYPSNADFVQLVQKSKRKWYGKKKRWTEVYEYYCNNYRNNIQNVTKDISKIKNEMPLMIDNLINTYIQKFDIYLKNYIQMSQSLYTYIDNYYENNIKDHQNINIRLNKYMKLLNDLLINDSNEKLFSRIQDK